MKQIRKDFEAWCRRNQVNPAGQFAREDAWPIWKAAYAVAARRAGQAAVLAAAAREGGAAC